ncbi:MAG: type II toxin-antitoxin system VapC family toxin [Microthrixaceae bacterium]
MTRRLVLDAAAGVELLLRTETGQRLGDRLPSDAEEWVPEVYFAEVAATLRRAELAGRLTPERASVALDDLLAGPLRRVQVKALLPEAWTLRHNVTITDALYVVLARHLADALVGGDL